MGEEVDHQVGSLQDNATSVSKTLCYYHVLK